MIVIDAYVWIEALQKTPTGIRYKTLWNHPDEITVSTTVQFEIYRWCLKNVVEDFAVNAISGTRRYAKFAYCYRRFLPVIVAHCL